MIKWTGLAFSNLIGLANGFSNPNVCESPSRMLSQLTCSLYELKLSWCEFFLLPNQLTCKSLAWSINFTLREMYITHGNEVFVRKFLYSSRHLYLVVKFIWGDIIDFKLGSKFMEFFMFMQADNQYFESATTNGDALMHYFNMLTKYPLVKD